MKCMNPSSTTDWNINRLYKLYTLNLRIFCVDKVAHYNQTREQVVEKWQKTHTSDPNEIKINFVGEIDPKDYFGADAKK